MFCRVFLIMRTLVHKRFSIKLALRSHSLTHPLILCSSLFVPPFIYYLHTPWLLKYVMKYKRVHALHPYIIIIQIVGNFFFVSLSCGRIQYFRMKCGCMGDKFIWEANFQIVKCQKCPKISDTENMRSFCNVFCFSLIILLLQSFYFVILFLMLDMLVPSNHSRMDLRKK